MIQLNYATGTLRMKPTAVASPSSVYLWSQLDSPHLSWQHKPNTSHTLTNTPSRGLLVYSTEKAMAPHSSTLFWKLPWVEEPGGLPSVGTLKVWHDWATALSLFTFMHWRRKWQPTPVFLPGESQGRGSLMGCRLWGRTESDTTEAI